MNAIEKMLESMACLAGMPDDIEIGRARPDPAKIAAAEKELARLLAIEKAAKLACGLLWMVDGKGKKTRAAYTTLRDAFGGSGPAGNLRECIQAAIDASYEVDHPTGASYWAGMKE